MRLALLVSAALVWFGAGCAPGAPEPGDVYTDVVVRDEDGGNCLGNDDAPRLSALAIDAGGTTWQQDEFDGPGNIGSGDIGTLTVLSDEGRLSARFDDADGDGSMVFSEGRFMNIAC